MAKRNRSSGHINLASRKRRAGSRTTKSLVRPQVKDVAGSSIYDYALNLQPSETVVKHIMNLNRQLAAESRKHGREISLEELDQRFQALFTNLLEAGICKRGPDAPPLLSKEQFLFAQRTIIARLIDGEEL